MVALVGPSREIWLKSTSPRSTSRQSVHSPLQSVLVIDDLTDSPRNSPRVHHTASLPFPATTTPLLLPRGMGSSFIQTYSEPFPFAVPNISPITSIYASSTSNPTGLSRLRLSKICLGAPLVPVSQTHTTAMSASMTGIMRAIISPILHPSNPTRSQTFLNLPIALRSTGRSWSS